MLLLKKIPRLIRWIGSVALIFLVALTVYRLYFFYHYRPAGKPFSGSAFLLGLRYDARVAAIIALAMLLVSLVLNPFKSRLAATAWNVIIPILFFIFFTTLLTDFYHFDYLHQRLNASVLSYLQDASISGNMVSQSYPVFKIVGIILLLTLFCTFISRKLKFYWETSYTNNSNYRPSAYILFSLFLSLVILGRVIYKPGIFTLRWSDAFEFGDDFKANVALNPFQSFFSSLKFRNSGYDINKVKQAYPLMTAYLGISATDTATLNYSRTINSTAITSTRPNVVLVICESFSAYKSSMYGNPLNTTPYFNELCKQGVFFERCFTPAYGTARGVWATLTGIPDVEPAPGTASRNPNAVDQHILMNDFKGYEKFYFLGGSASWANIRGLLTNNIDSLHLYEEGDYKAKGIDVWGISDKNLLLEANGILKKQQKPFFAIIQTAENHRPYTIPKEDEGIFTKLNVPLDTLRKYGFESNAEYNGFRYTDFSFQQFMEAAKKEAYYSNTIFVFIGDHGIRGNAGSLFPKCWTEQGLTTTHVPLLFYAPAFLKSARRSDVCSQVDVMPSIAYLCNQPLNYRALGQNVFEGRVSYYNKGSHAFIIDPDIHSIGMLNDRYYYLQNLNSGKEEFLSMKGNELVSDSASKAEMKKLTEAYYETARYLLLNNKKKVAR